MSFGGLAGPVPPAGACACGAAFGAALAGLRPGGARIPQQRYDVKILLLCPLSLGDMYPSVVSWRKGGRSSSAGSYNDLAVMPRTALARLDVCEHLTLFVCKGRLRSGR